ncbi:MAG: hypothetical protein ABI873_10015, partial [Marmoricola sp.]
VVGGVTYALGLVGDSFGAVRFGSRLAGVGGYITAPLAFVDLYRHMSRKFDPQAPPMDMADSGFEAVDDTLKIAAILYPEALIGAAVVHYGLRPVAQKTSEYLTPMFIGGISQAYGVPEQDLWGMH